MKTTYFARAKKLDLTLKFGVYCSVHTERFSGEDYAF